MGIMGVAKMIDILINIKQMQSNCHPCIICSLNCSVFKNCTVTDTSFVTMWKTKDHLTQMRPVVAEWHMSGNGLKTVKILLSKN